MLLTSVLASLLAWLTRSTPIFIVKERLNNNNTYDKDAFLIVVLFLHVACSASIVFLLCLFNVCLHNYWHFHVILINAYINVCIQHFI